MSSSEPAMKPVTPGSISSGMLPRPKATTGQPGQHRLDERESERLVPVDRHEQRPRITEERHLLLGADAAEAGHVRGLKPGLHQGAGIVVVRGVRLAGHADRHAGKGRGVDRRVGPLLAGEAPDEADVRPRVLGPAVASRIEPVVDDGRLACAGLAAGPGPPRWRRTRPRGNGGSTRRAPGCVDVVQGVDQRRVGHETPEREGGGRVRVDQVESALGDLAQRPGAVVEIGDALGRPLGARVQRAQGGAGVGVARREEGHVVSPVQQAFHQLVDHQLGATVVPRRDRHERRRDHCDAHAIHRLNWYTTTVTRVYRRRQPRTARAGAPWGAFAVRDFRMWWALFVFFGVLSVLAVQQGYRRWRRAWEAVAAASGPGQAERQRRLRREGIRLACMAASVITMTALVFAALLRAPAAVLIGLRLLAVAGVAGVVWLSVRR